MGIDRPLRGPGVRKLSGGGGDSGLGWTAWGAPGEAPRCSGRLVISL